MRQRAVIIAATLGLAAGCGGASAPRDASGPISQQSAALHLRIELPASGAATASAIAFRAASARVPPEAVSGLVDPLSAPGPAEGSGCILRDADAAVRALAASGGFVQLEELPGLEIEIPATPGTFLRPSARLYPDLGALGGVVSEAAPMDLSVAPSSVVVASSEPDHKVVNLEVPEPARVLALGGLGPLSGTPIPTAAAVGQDLDVAVTAGAAVTVEVRPFGGTAGVSCAADANGRALVPHGLLASAGARAGSVLSVDAVRRASTDALIGGQSTRLTVEVRAATLVELRP